MQPDLDTGRNFMKIVEDVREEIMRDLKKPENATQFVSDHIADPVGDLEIMLRIYAELSDDFAELGLRISQVLDKSVRVAVEFEAEKRYNNP